MKLLSSAYVRRLLHKKYVAVLGDSVNKDLVQILQNDDIWTGKQLKGKGDKSFANDTTDQQLVGFYFLTHVSSEYKENVLANFQHGPQPDVVIINSCIYDDSRYHEQSLQMYKNNLDHLFIRLTEVLSPKCLLICNTSMSVEFKAKGNFYSTTLADLHQLDVIDLHFHLRFKLHSRVNDATHSNQLAHRKYTCILMAHID
uniref:Uncharacterized protein n=1 Tax=Pyxicephalus adspersus TaxID=30357 RepID=A0AAV3A4P9_PYXAD|nr:TPA: hypothetical protein GDO54_018128 [Pyxicephalus adspersus]